MIDWPTGTHEWLLAVAAVGLTLLVFYTARWLFVRWGELPLLHPVLIAVLVLIGVLLVAGVSYEDYWLGGQWIHFFLGPATVALAWPLFQHLTLVKSLLWPILISVLAGLLFGSVCVVLLAGTSAFLYQQKINDKKALSQFLIIRGLWLIFIEVVVINASWTLGFFWFEWGFFLQVIWAIGVAMLALAVLI